MKHVPAFQEFLNENNNAIIFSVDDDKLDQLLQAKFGKEIDYENIKDDSYYVLPKKSFDRFIDLADSSGFDVDYNDSENSVVYVYESVNEAKGKLYKYTGIFAPLHQIRSILAYKK